MIFHSHEFHVFSKSGLSSGVVVVDLIHVYLHVEFIVLAFLVHSVWDFIWVLFFEFLGVEVIFSLEIYIIPILAGLVHSIWDMVWVLLFVILGQEQVVHLEEQRI